MEEYFKDYFTQIFADGKMQMGAEKNLRKSARKIPKNSSRRWAQIETADGRIRNSHFSNSSFLTA
ncbi:MAG: hypothetical protein ACOYU1_10030 [Bacteroidota bacterium]